MGMNHLEEIDTLARIARPHWGVITNTGTAHIGEVGGFEKIIDAKLELASHLSEGRLFAGVTHVSFARRLTELHGIRLESVVEKHIANELGKQKLNSLVFHAHQRDLNHLDVRWSAEKKAHTAALPVFGNHFASNFLVAARVARAMGLSWDAIKRTGATLHLPGMRCETLSTPTGTTFLLDCYNANYDSTLGLINTLMAFRIPRVKRKKTSVPRARRHARTW
jgi:UDP-N-acetylmuramoyl-tripeptide--D-alanyl-D-alanine ligase